VVGCLPVFRCSNPTLIGWMSGVTPLSHRTSLGQFSTLAVVREACDARWHRTTPTWASTSGGGDGQGSAYALPFGDHSFDTVTLCEILEHLDRPLHALSEAARVARTRIVITVPNDYSLVRLARLALGRPVEIEHEHILSYNGWNLTRLLERVGFGVVEEFSYPLRLQCVCNLSIRSRFGYWLFCVADRAGDLKPKIAATQ